MLITIAPDKFKGTLSAEQAAKAIAAGVAGVFPDAGMRLLPMADGGEGTAAILAAAKGWERHEISAFNSIGEPITAVYYADKKNETGVIDSSSVIGLQMIAPGKRDPWKASSYPLGIVVRQLLEGGMKKLFIAIGGTSTVDAGIGFLQGLGAGIYCACGLLDRPFRACDLMQLLKVDLSGLNYSDRIIGLSDVDVPLCDNEGYPSMLMFAPQKGVDDDSLIVLKMGLDRLYEQVRWLPDYPMLETRFGGAGGGIGFAIAGALGCETEFGAARLISENALFDPLPDLIITGEGSYDNQSLQGKVTSAIMNSAISHNIPCVIIAGRVEKHLQSRSIIQATPEGISPTPAQAAEFLTKAAAKVMSR